MIKPALFAIAVGICATLSAQPVTRLSASTDQFPEVSFTVRDRNPEAADPARLALTENGKPLKFTLTAQKDDRQPAGKDVLILFENSHWSEFGPQREYFKKLLSQALKGKSAGSDRYFLATFDWTRKDGTVLVFSDSDAYTDPAKLLEAVQAIKAPASDARIHRSTELFQALSEGIGFVSRKRGANAPAILLLSAEFSNVFNDKFDDEEVVVQARRADVPVYAIRYPRMGGKYSLSRVVTESYGLHEEADTEKPSKTEEALKAMLEKIPQRALGKVYLLKTTVSAEPDGQAHSLEIVLNGAEKYQLDFTSPGRIAHLLRNPLYLVLAIVLALALLGTGIWLFLRAKKRSNQEKLQAAQKLESARREAAEALQAQEQRFQQTLEHKEHQAREEQRRQEEASFYAEKSARMKFLPRFPGLTDRNGHRHEIGRPVMRMGRDQAQSDLVFADPSVSRAHAVIGFEHGAGLSSPDMAGRFYIWDVGSSNGTYVNEQLLPRPGETGYGPRELRNNDIVRLGSLSFSFNF